MLSRDSVIKIVALSDVTALARHMQVIWGWEPLSKHTKHVIRREVIRGRSTMDQL